MTHNQHEHSETFDALRHGYYQLLERIYARLLDEPENQPANRARIAQLAEEEAAGLDTPDFRHEIVEAVKDDLEHTRESLASEGESIRDTLRDWAGDIGAKLLSIADHTDVTLEQIRNEAERTHPREWTTGHATSPKRLKCVDCGTILHHDTFGPLPACPECGGHSFRRA
ncbi:zinc ribbon-containing protein [Guyparkeria sp. TX1]|uniref:zinc ribbon-containing protein n=1 Tax=Guyparkeria sp. TX1 TaxID=3115001 RepID=UPI003977BC63